MSLSESLLFLVGFPLALLLAGYWLVACLKFDEFSSRPAVAMLAGLGSLLFTSAWVNYFLPISGIAAWLCLIPIAASLFWQRSRTLLATDLRLMTLRRSFWAAAVLMSLGFTALLWPQLRDPSIMLHEGGGNHDSFFWIVNAEHLQRHPFIKPSIPDPLHPLTITAGAVSGWTPAWGRMGTEGLLALASSLCGLPVLRIYALFSAALSVAWLAAGLIAVRLFYSRKLSLLAQVGLLILQPVFIYFHRNSNLPNLLGVIMGSAACLATELALRQGAGCDQRGVRLAWCSLIALSLHGLYCTYSEMIPFVLLPCGLLWLRAWRTRPTALAWWVASAVAASLLLNPATTFRAGWGFYAALLSARADDRWADILVGLSPLQYIPALATLAPPAAKALPPWIAAGVSVILTTGVGLAWHRARDRLGVLLVFSGGLLLLGYTLISGFTYGWQKSVQFCGIFLSMAVAVAAVDALFTYVGPNRSTRYLTRLGSIALAGFLLFATGMQLREIIKWSERKALSQDWLVLLDHSRTTLREAPVLIDATTFHNPFFHSMWATYFLSGSDVYFSDRGKQGGGYLHHAVVREAPRPDFRPDAVLLGRAWADAFDSNSPRLIAGREFALLERVNRVFDLTGLSPLNGPPSAAARRFSITIEPVVAASLEFTLSPQVITNVPSGASWEIHRQTDNGEDFITRIDGSPPWRFQVPISGRTKQTLRFSMAGESKLLEGHPFDLSDLHVSSVARALNPAGDSLDFVRSPAWQDHLPTGLSQDPLYEGTLARHDEASWSFTATSATADVALELIAVPRLPGAPEPPPLLTELWFNDSLIFTGFFAGPGVLRARILSEHWNQQPRGSFRLRFPDNPADGPQLLLKTLNIRAETSSRP